jgi:hypothetical protein
MAFSSWVADVSCSSLPAAFDEPLRRLELSINTEFSMDGLMFADDPVSSSLPHIERVRINAQWLSPLRRDCLIEVRSGEPHNQRRNRCFRVAAELAKTFPPNKVL